MSINSRVSVQEDVGPRVETFTLKTWLGPGAVDRSRAHPPTQQINFITTSSGYMGSHTSVSEPRFLP